MVTYFQRLLNKGGGVASTAPPPGGWGGGACPLLWKYNEQHVAAVCHNTTFATPFRDLAAPPSLGLLFKSGDGVYGGGGGGSSTRVC